MYIGDINNFVCEYSYEDEEEVYTMSSSSPRYLKKKLSELLDCDKDVTYKIYAVLEEGVLEA